jgi:chorismate synthase
MTAPLCIAGGVCLQLLERAGVRVAAHLLAVAGEKDAPFAAGGIAPWDPAALEVQLEAIAAAPTFTTIEPAAKERMQAAIEAANQEKDSVGGVVECVVCGLPAGVGAPMAAGVENALAANLFGIPAVKGVEFGAGFAAASMRGSAHNDAFTVNAAGAVTPATNTAGGILGGISTGAPVVFRVAIKPTASIAVPQQSANYATASEERIVVHGRHDPCIAPRAVPVVEAVAAFTVADLILSEYPELLATPPAQKRIE